MLGGPRIVDLEEVPEQEVVRVDYADGRRASVYERFLETNPRMFTFHNRWDPGAMSLRHGHQADHIVFVLEGEVQVGERLCRKGAHIFLMHGDRFGPWIAGPQGCELLGVIAGNPMAFWTDDDMAEFDALLARHDAALGSVPPIKHIPAWMPRKATVPKQDDA